MPDNPQTSTSSSAVTAGARQRVGPNGRHRQCSSPTDAHGFVIDRVEVVFLGRCPQCLAGRSGAPHVAPRVTQPET